ncbi:hypothetical protein NHX12_031202 [Muraenolepis orangiensis]|uniref:Uncharacterized protein n=1 Tax=Muraenolepis orangiensis TaxID=630683 RepID=A0A9Q0E4U0_9TELE|nr:hypothetical protein NHX12_031202 [Muraenolepis orangiensis]
MTFDPREENYILSYEPCYESQPQFTVTTKTLAAPRHGLVLLYWFANNIDIDNNDIIPLNFEPNRGDYGIHHYGNYEELLTPLRNRCNLVPGSRDLYEEHSYYALGNLRQNNNHNNALALPSYVTRSFYNPGGYPDNNRDRIILRVRQVHNALTGRTRRTIDQVFITQHPPRQTTYDPAHTYRVTANLLREIRGVAQIDVAAVTPRQLRERYHRDVDQSYLNQLRPWGALSSLGLLLLLVLDRRTMLRFGKSILHILYLGLLGAGAAATRRRREGEEDEEEDEDVLLIQLDVRTVAEGKAKICWRGVPPLYLRCAKVALFRSNEDRVQLSSFFIGDRSSGDCDTLVPLHPGLQVRLLKVDPRRGAGSDQEEEILRGPEFHDANREMPVYLKDQDGASLQLFVCEGRACVRLYVRFSFLDWRSRFEQAWVGVFASGVASTPIQRQALLSLRPEDRTDSADIPDYAVYVFQSTVPVSPGLQARFLCPSSPEPLASTPPWEGYVPQPAPETRATPHDEL